MPYFFGRKKKADSDSSGSEPAKPPGVPSKPRLEGFLGIPWGTDQDGSIEAMLTREGVSFDEQTSNPSSLFFNGGSFGGQPYWMCVLQFGEDGMHTAKVVYVPKEHELISTFYKYVSLFTEKYGKPDNQFEFYDDPYFKGDGYETQAIRLGKGHLSAAWVFPDPGREDYVTVEITDTLTLVITYQDGDLIHKAVEQQQQRNLTDL